MQPNRSPAERPPRPGSRPGGCAAARPCRGPAPRPARSRSPVTENGEQGATPIRSIESGPGSWCVSTAAAVAARIVSMSSTTWSGGSPPWRRPRSIEPRVGMNRRPDPRGPPRSRRRARRRRRPGRRSGGPSRWCSRCGPARPARPRRPRRPTSSSMPPQTGYSVVSQPNRVVVDGQPAGDPLVEVVVGVDQARGDQAAGGVDARAQAARGRPAGPTAAIRPSSTTTWPTACSVRDAVHRHDGGAVQDHDGRHGHAHGRSRSRRG